MRSAHEAVLNLLPYGVVLLDDRRRVLTMNREAERIVSARDGIRFGAGEVRASDPDASCELAGAIARACSEIDSGPLPVPLAEVEAERIVWRLLATLAGASAADERLRLRLRQRRGMARLTVRLPGTLAAKSDAELFRAGTGGPGGGLSSGSFGIGFALRLVAAEARAAGGQLERRGDRLRMEIAGLTRPAAPHSHAGGATGGQAA